MKKFNYDIRNPNEYSEAFVKILEKITDSMPDAEEVFIRSTSMFDDGSFSVRMVVKDKNGVKIAYIERDVYIKASYIKLELFALDQSLQGKGIAKKLHSMQLDFVKKYKINEYKVNANIDVGGYAWLKYGMVPDDPDRLLNRIIKSRKLDSSIRAKVKQDIEGLSPSKRIAYLRENLSLFKPALLRADWFGGLNLKEDTEGLRMLEEYISSKPRKPTKSGGEARTLATINTRHQVYLERLKSHYVGNYSSVLKEIDKAIREILGGLNSETLSDLKEKEFRALLRRLRTQQGKLSQEFTDRFLQDLKKLAPEEVAFEISAMTSVTNDKLVLNAADGFAYAMNHPIQATGDLLEDFVSDLSKRNIARIERAIRVGRAQGKTISQMVYDIRGRKKFNYKDGILQKNWNDARTVVRTSTQHISQSARSATWEANSNVVDGYQVVATLDSSTSKICRSLDGQRFKVNKGPLPPFHPNCRTTTVPTFKSGVDIFEFDVTRASANGQVNAKLSYYDWLKQQPKSFQDDAIGPVYGKLFRDGGLSTERFADLQLDRNFNPLTLEQMRKLQPNAFERAGI